LIIRSSRNNISHQATDNSSAAIPSDMAALLETDESFPAGATATSHPRSSVSYDISELYESDRQVDGCITSETTTVPDPVADAIMSELYKVDQKACLTIGSGVAALLETDRAFPAVARYGAVTEVSENNALPNDISALLEMDRRVPHRIASAPMSEQSNGVLSSDISALLETDKEFPVVSTNSTSSCNGIAELLETDQAFPVRVKVTKQRDGVLANMQEPIVPTFMSEYYNALPSKPCLRLQGIRRWIPC